MNITITSTINAPVSKVWDFYSKPEHITKWNNAGPDWHTPRATNDLRVGGNFNYRMEARDGSMGFDFAGTYTEVVPQKKIAYTFGDRKTVVLFEEVGGQTKVTTTFDLENENPIEMQRAGWQSILDNFKKYVETN